MDFGKFISLNYWFETRPNTISPEVINIMLIMLLLVLGLFVITKILVKVEVKRKNIILSRYYKKWSNLWLTLLIVSAFLTFFRYEGIPFLSGRFWFAVLYLGIIVWVGFLVFYYFKRIPKQKNEVSEKSDFDKYLPKKSKNKKKKK